VRYTSHKLLVFPYLYTTTGLTVNFVRKWVYEPPKGQFYLYIK
jgi:hypothetical protein